MRPGKTTGRTNRLPEETVMDLLDLVAIEFAPSVLASIASNGHRKSGAQEGVHLLQQRYDAFCLLILQCMELLLQQSSHFRCHQV